MRPLRELTKLPQRAADAAVHDLEQFVARTVVGHHREEAHCADNRPRRCQAAVVEEETRSGSSRFMSSIAMV